MLLSQEAVFNVATRATLYISCFSNNLVFQIAAICSANFAVCSLCNL